jgi:hypothetical protein
VPDRLDELRRQRALQREHLAWIDREIAALEGSAPAPAAAAPPLIGEITPDNRDAEAILAEYRQPAVSVSKRARMGCLLYFGIALALIAVALTALYFEVSARRGH